MEKEEIVATETQGLRVNDQKSSESKAEASDILYELTEGSDDSDSSDGPDISDKPEETDVHPGSEDAEKTENSEKSAAEAELEKMLSEVGADTLLQIIKDNRNAAIRQIIREVEASRDRSIPSGASAAPSCSSIFDLAALA